MGVVSDEQLIFLDNLIYFDLSDFEDASLLETIESIIGDIEYHCGEEPPACMSQSEWSHLLFSFCYEVNPEYLQNQLNGIVDETVEPNRIKEKHREFLSEYVLENYSDEPLEEGGFRACCFVKRNSENEVEDVITIFRGTAGDAPEWADNVLNANRVWSYEMDKSIDYIDTLPIEYGDNITVSGHSKGGKTGFELTSDDAFLALDRNGDGTINDSFYHFGESNSQILQIFSI